MQKILMNKKGHAIGGEIQGVVAGVAAGILAGIIGFIVAFFLVGGLAPTLTSASTQISGSGLPLASLFSSTGPLFTIFMILLFVGMLGLCFIVGFQVYKHAK